MEFFRKLMSFFGASQPECDLTKRLPVEISQHIFGMLDARSLLNVAQVSRRWLHVCRGDPRLRATARRHLRREKRRAYGLPSAGKPKMIRLRKSEVVKEAPQRISEKNEVVRKVPQKISQKSVGEKVPVKFTFGPSGVSRGPQAQSGRRVSGSRPKVETKRINLRMRFIIRAEGVLREICLVEICGCTLNICFIGYYLMMEWAQADAMGITTYTILLISFVFNIFLFCYIGECLTEKCEKVGETTYMIEWYRLPEKEAVGLTLIISTAQHPATITAGKMIGLSLNSFCLVIRTSVGYLNLLRTMMAGT